MGYANVVDDYCHGNALESNPKFFTDALMVAVDYSKLFDCISSLKGILSHLSY